MGEKNKKKSHFRKTLIFGKKKYGNPRNFEKI